jgi:hypothetical protein
MPGPTAAGRAAVLRALSDTPTGTSELYDVVGYPALVSVGLVPYPAFRATLEALTAEGEVEMDTAPDGTTLWRRRQERAREVP